ncbi:hypothetical protein [Plantibacter sp. M259]|uniref:hypothetical protein n=1 Tax=Plantibacter sp. M259 TaxID=2583822 RepID=UPI003518F2ED
MTIDTLADLDGLTDWVHAGAQGVLLLDCRISTSVVAPYLSEMMQQGPRPVAVD